ncbi:MAG: VTT domain-containing protein [Chloroflexi bacterium]|nr:VTT domain-containing protein [Chloroflexota bacterium]
MPFDLLEIIRAVGYVGLFGIVFAESGLFFGFFLPGDSLLFTAGFLASQGVFNLPVLMLLLSIAAITGDSVGYWTGEKFGRRLFKDNSSFWRNPKHLDAAHEFYEKHGGKAIILARFLPAVRTFVPIVAGMAQMSYRKFLFFNIFGGIGWVVLLTGAGFALIELIKGPYELIFKKPFGPEDIDKVLLPVILVIIVVSVLPTAIHLYRENREFIHRKLGERFGRRAAAQAD